jgi:aminoglycoside phosphotransferase (APT) family kinase protein
MPDAAELARRFVPGRAAPLLRPLSRGLASSTHRVERDGACYVLRVADGPAGEAERGALTAFAPAWECRVMAAAAAAGLAPLVERCDPAAGVLVTRWVAGRCWSAAEARSPQRVPAIAALLRRIHALPAPPPPRLAGPADWIHLYRRGAGDTERGSDPLAPTAAACLAGLERLPAAPQVVCHSDLHRLNLLDCGGVLVALDWEYAHVGDGLWDVAGWLSMNDLGPERGRPLLKAYLGREANADEAARLGLLGWLYDYVAWLWCRVHALRAREQSAGPIAARAAELASRLGAGSCGPLGELPAHYVV